MLLIICTPWLTPIANTRKGTSMEYGSIPKPRTLSRPNCQTTPMVEHSRGTSSAPDTARIQVQEHHGRQEGYAEEHAYLAGARYQVADNLGKSDDMNRYVIITVFVANQGFQIL